MWLQFLKQTTDAQLLSHAYIKALNNALTRKWKDSMNFTTIAKNQIQVMMNTMMALYVRCSLTITPDTSASRLNAQLFCKQLFFDHNVNLKVGCQYWQSAFFFIQYAEAKKQPQDTEINLNEIKHQKEVVVLLSLYKC